MAWLSEPIDSPIKADDPVFAVQMQNNEVLLGLTPEIPEHLEYLLWLCEPHRYPLRGIVADNLVAITGFD